MTINPLLLWKPHDLATDSIIFTAFTSPWAVFASLDKTVALGVLNLLILAFFRWRALRLRAREIELKHSEELVTIRTRLSFYEDGPAAAGSRAIQKRDRQPVLPRPVRQRGVAGRS